MRQRHAIWAVLVATVAALTALSLPAAASAQATPEAEPEVPGAFPVHIHEGTCADIGEVLFPLDDVNPVGAELATPSTTEVATPSIEEVVEDLGGTPVVVGATVEINAPLEDLVAVTTVLDVHESEDDFENQVACGAISGSAEDGRILVIIEELNESGYSGEAELIDNGDGTTTARINMVHRPGDAAATPET